MTYRVKTCYQIIWTCNNSILFEIVSYENGNKNYFLAAVNRGVFFIYLALIRDNGIVGVFLIHGP
jgi:hypothetical protein